MSKLNNLTCLKLEFCENQINDEGSVKIGECITKLHNLNNLKLNINSKKISAEGVAFLCEGVS